MIILEDDLIQVPDDKICLECTCGLVISGLTNAANPLFTKGGSFWHNDTTELLDLSPLEDPRFQPRNQCVRHGYASIALIPIRNQTQVVGLIQLNDRRKGRFTTETVERLEGIAAHLGEALVRRQVKESLKEALLTAETAARVKSEFLSVMSHELRTPLNGVLGFAELLTFTQLNEEQKQYTQLIHTSGEHLLAVVNDILDFSSLEKGSLTINAEPVQVAELVTSSCFAAQQAAARKGIKFRCEVASAVPKQFLGDERRIRQILINLLGNAVKFTSDGTVVLRLLLVTEGGHRMLEFAVEDTGIGISPAMLEQLFKPFSQEDTGHSRAFQGTGLGLAISQRLAEAMNSTIAVVSTPDQGSIFSLRLPLSAAQPSTGGAGTQPEFVDPPPATTEPPVGELVLVAEDDPNNSLLAGAMLRRLGYRVEYAANGVEAVTAFKPGKFFAILMDMRMPVMDGLAAARIIRDLDPDVPIIALTANVMPGDRERCLAAGMSDYLSKPFNRADLVAKLDYIREKISSQYRIHPS